MGLPVYDQPINGPPPRFMSPVWTEREVVDNCKVAFNSFEEFLETRHTWVNEWYDPIRSWHTQYDYVCDEDKVYTRNHQFRCNLFLHPLVDMMISFQIHYPLHPNPRIHRLDIHRRRTQ